MNDSFWVVIMGDSSSSVSIMNSDILRIHLKHLRELSPQPQFVFFLGDMVYGGDKVNEQLEMWKSLVQEYYPINMFYPALGNHEDDETAFSNAFPYLPKDQLAGYQRTVYYFDFESTRFIVLNSNRIDSGGNYVINSDQRAWLERTLKSSEKKYNFVMFHVPAFPTGQHYGESLDGNPEERNALWAILDRDNVTAVFVGHEHNYCRRLIDKSFIMSNSSLALKNSIYQVTTGGAGTSLNKHADDIRNVMIGPLTVYHYVVMDISEQAVLLKAYDKEYNLIDSCDFITDSGGESSISETDIIIPICAEWKYLDNGSNQESLWREPPFDDSGWFSGLAELGYGDGGEATVVKYGPNVNKKYITTYFRKHFTIENASIYKSMTVRIQRDDGAVVYLNGKEVFRTNMPSGIISYNTLASKALNGSEEIAYEQAVIDAGILKNGDNVIAVEIHQASYSSSDISFNFQLLGHKKL